ncbi:MAG: VanZ family protein [Pigmentiphaga sp.]|uniref:VanZ family protein n=1 Tax=Pigmentiphaga sp. TaxID=1977564 RepID=UPI0029ABE267|nr:VanZ family protein [Pigmentiphaga sp.]MDX3906863.1 VanZ family protein [Pigmentiphaga sp.]
MSADGSSAASGQVVRRGAPLTRLALSIVVLLVVYASLYPFTGWVGVGVPAFAYLSAPWPQYWVGSEIIANVAAYLPVGALFVWAVYPACRGLLAVVIAVVFCGLLSGTMEALQTYLPNRIASNVDLAANAAGALLGALAGTATASRLIGDGALARWRQRWFTHQAGPALILAALWVFMQIPRQPMLFGTGELWLLLGDWAAVPSELLGQLWSPTPAQRITAEQFCTGAAVVGVAMLLLHVARPVPARGILPGALVVCALLVKIAFQPLAVPAQAPGAWITAGAAVGSIAGVLLATGFAYLKPGWQRGLGILALCLQLGIVNLFPSDQYFDTTTAMARTGWLHLESLTLGLSVIWPLAALFFLARRRSA